MTNGFTQVKHSIWEFDLTMEERYMLMFLLDCEDKFNKKDDWFGLTDQDFIDVGFGKNKAVLRKTRNSLVERGYIEFKPGKFEKKSQYKFKRRKNYGKDIRHEGIRQEIQGEEEAQEAGPSTTSTDIQSDHNQGQG